MAILTFILDKTLKMQLMFIVFLVSKKTGKLTAQTHLFEYYGIFYKTFIFIIRLIYKEILC